MKKVLLSLMILLLCFSSRVFAEDTIGISIDGEAIIFDVQPMIIEGRTIVPVSAVFEALGLDVTWDEKLRMVTGIKDNLVVILTIDNHVAKVNNLDMILDVPAVIIDNRTMVPLRFVAEATGANVEWNKENQTIEVFTFNETGLPVEDLIVTKQSVDRKDTINWEYASDIEVSLSQKEIIEEKLLKLYDYVIGTYIPVPEKNNNVRLTLLSDYDSGYAGNNEAGVMGLTIGSKYLKIFKDSGNYFILYHEYTHVLDIENVDIPLRSFREGFADFISYKVRVTEDDDVYDQRLTTVYNDLVLDDFRRYLITCGTSDDLIDAYKAGHMFYSYLEDVYGSKVILDFHNKVSILMKESYDVSSYEEKQVKTLDALVELTSEDVYKNFKDWYIKKYR